MNMLWILLRRLLPALCLALVPLLAGAQTRVEADLVCPIDGKPFTTILAIPETPIGFHLDLKPYGPGSAPWPLAKCPANGFVMYKREFPDEELARLRPYVRSAEYQALSAAHTNHYLSARLREHLGASPAELAYVLLQATWEAGSPAQYRMYASETLNALNTVLAGPVPNPKEWINAQFVAGELERRLGRFADAKTRFQALDGHAAVTEDALRNVLRLQLRLIEAKDTKEHPIPR